MALGVLEALSFLGVGAPSCQEGVGLAFPGVLACHAVAVPVHHETLVEEDLSGMAEDQGAYNQHIEYIHKLNIESS